MKREKGNEIVSSCKFPGWGHQACKAGLSGLQRCLISETSSLSSSFFFLPGFPILKEPGTQSRIGLPMHWLIYLLMPAVPVSARGEIGTSAFQLAKCCSPPARAEPHRSCSCLEHSFFFLPCIFLLSYAPVVSKNSFHPEWDKTCLAVARNSGNSQRHPGWRIGFDQRGFSQ